MEDKKYTLRFLPLFEEDLNEIIDYICFEFKNPEAAKHLIEEVEKAIDKRLFNPKSFEPHYSVRERKYPYYKINVRNFTVFYVVIDDVMEVRRILYSRRDLTKLI